MLKKSEAFFNFFSSPKTTNYSLCYWIIWQDLDLEAVQPRAIILTIPYGYLIKTLQLVALSVILLIYLYYDFKSIRNGRLVLYN